MIYFADCQTIEDLKREYRRLAMLHHPDMPHGDVKTMQAINTEYQARFDFLKDLANGKADRQADIHEESRDFVAIIDKIIGLDGLEIELVGCWVWVSGDTKRHKDALKAAGMRWSGKRQRWYWRPGESRKRWCGSKASYKEICDKYGCERISGAGRIAVA